MVNTGRQHVVPFAFLEALRPDLLRQLLTAYSASLARLGAPLEAGPISRDWLAQFYEVLRFDNPLVPLSLQTAVLDVLDLGCEAGALAILEHTPRVAEEPGARTLGACVGTGEYHNFALWFYLNQPAVFRAAHARVCGCSGLWLAEYGGDDAPDGRQSRRPTVDGIVRRHALVLDRLGRFIRHIAMDSLDQELVFRFRIASFDDRAGPSTTGLADAVVYDKNTDCLSLNVKDPQRLELYRMAAGLLIGADTEYFQDRPLYTAWPLQELGSGALDVRDVPEFAQVSLASVTYTDGNRIVRTDSAPAGSDLVGDFDRRLRSGVLRQATISAWTFLVTARQAFRPLGVEIRPPNRLRFDRRLPLPHLLAFLSARGYLLR